ncbi:hypothetical protein Aros01_07920 [Streptosporangium roseum]|uniref:Tc1-like transposase DDE domain-containing protein n=1 Tax=Streptosporangium roseum (strain ATCC 12428 / DSM 43021 / JCM 3005 / KCTC 9067 / NCIMB 10171 / NRRL 2505 / NI 9100) TaxID=479432 RepID=D2ATH9_STRRD|nr:helix-turn-helix domain-containing protein [Streptosporangium roseum]ACZ86699.1 hypothetical protein Sros_3777 [Streptosporangium roseum DSM 43021]
MRPSVVFANAQAVSIEHLQAQLRGRWRQATRAVMLPLSLHGLPAVRIADLLGHDPGTARRWIDRFNRHGMAGLADRFDRHGMAGLADRFDRHGMAGLADRPRPGRPHLGGQRLTDRIAALPARPRDHGRSRGCGGCRTAPPPPQQAHPVSAGAAGGPLAAAPHIIVICDNDGIHHARTVTAHLVEHPRLELLYGARYSPHDAPVERVRAGLKAFIANTAVTWPGRLRQIHAFLRARSPDQLPTAAAPWTSPWLPAGYKRNFWNAA